MNKEEFISIFDSTDHVVELFCEKAKNHNYYKYYSNLTRIESNFIRDKSFFLSNGNMWNDRNDYIRFNPPNSDKMRFGMSFSFSKSESVAMWMLYGGTQLNGAMIDIPPTLIRSVLKNVDVIELGYFNDDHEFCVIENLTKDCYSILVQDVLYFGDSKADVNQYYYVKRSDNSFDCADKQIISDYSVIRKRTAWSYENETRLIVSVNKSAIKSTRDELIIKIQFNDFYDEPLDGRIRLSPNYNSDNRDYSRSYLSAELEWDLCKGCLIKREATNDGEID